MYFTAVCVFAIYTKENANQRRKAAVLEAVRGRGRNWEVEGEAMSTIATEEAFRENNAVAGERTTVL